ncbi:MAG: Uma2 family endonuclease [Planctomycetes bacterium]|nr:Uma2 family endonuclease [Planctomycetota bacterium]
MPELCAGDRLTRDEFERRYDAMPHLKKAELIEGVVYVGSPVRLVQHGLPERILSRWLGWFQDQTPGVVVSGNTTVRLDQDNEPQPDLLARLPEGAGGRSRAAADGHLEGPPELVVEIAASSVSYDLHQKFHAYRRSGVLEYLVHRVDDGEVDWFVLERGAYRRQEMDADGILRSRVFPGLWLDVEALLRQHELALQAAIHRGCSTDEHAEFVARLAAAGPG